MQGEGQVERGLPAKLGDGAPALFAFVNVQYILECQRLEKQLVAGVIIRGHGFGVGIDHDGLEAVLFEGEGGVDAAIVELDALADAVGAAPEDHHFFGGVALHLVVAPVVGGVIVRRVGLEFGGAGVHQPVAGDDPEALAFGVLGLTGQMGDLPVGKSERLGLGEFFGVE